MGQELCFTCGSIVAQLFFLSNYQIFKRPNEENHIRKIAIFFPYPWRRKQYPLLLGDGGGKRANIIGQGLIPHLSSCPG